MRRFTTLTDEIQYRKLISEEESLRQKPSVSIVQKMNRISDSHDHKTFIKHQNQRSNFKTHLTRILPDRLIKNTDKQVMHYKNTNNFKLAFSEYYLMLILLQKYQLLNFTGFIKILKKHDKLFQTTRGEEWR